MELWGCWAQKGKSALGVSVVKKCIGRKVFKQARERKAHASLTKTYKHQDYYILPEGFGSGN